MRYNRLGSTGLFVSQLCLGTMTFGGEGIFGMMGAVQQNEADSMLSEALKAGVNFIDTADIYSQGSSERITGQAIRNLGVGRSSLVLATKAYGEMGPGPNDRGASRGHIMSAVEASLERLQTDYIDLYQMHGFDQVTPVDETMRALDDLVSQGLVRYIGVSNARAWEVMKANGIAQQRGWSRYESLQAYYSVAGRDIERDIVPFLRNQGVGLLVWSPLAGGALSGKVDRNTPVEKGSRRSIMAFPPVVQERAFDCIDVMRPIAKGKGVSVAQIALAWLLHQPHVTSVIVGSRTLAQFEDNLRAAEVKLEAAELAAINAVSELSGEYPGWMFPAFVDAQRYPKGV